MNIVRHRVYKLEFDVWEPMDKPAQAEIDAIIYFATRHSSHLGNLRITPVSEERV